MRTYSVIRGEHPAAGEWTQSVVETGLTFEAARASQAARDRAERLLHPERSSWTATHHHIQLEEPSTAAVELLEASRCALSVLFLLSDEVEGLGCRGDGVAVRLRAAVDRAAEVCGL